MTTTNQKANPNALQRLAAKAPEEIRPQLLDMASTWAKERKETSWLLDRASPAYQFSDEDDDAETAAKDKWIDRVDALIEGWS